MQLILREYNLKLKHTFTISRESIDFQPSLIVELQSEGYSGFGEATSNPYYHTTVPMMRADLENIRSLIENSDILRKLSLFRAPLGQDQPLWCFYLQFS